MMKLILYILPFLLISNSWGQSIFSSEDIRMGIFDVVDEDKTLRSEFIENVQISKDNYFIRSVDKDYILVFGQLNAARGVINQLLNQLKSEDQHKCSIGVKFKPSGLLVESEFRHTYFFKRENGYRAMLTTWNVERSGANLSFPKYLVNDSVDGKNVVNVLAVPIGDKLHRAVWKSIWHKGGIFFELYIETTLNPPLILEFDYARVVEVLKSSKCSTSTTKN